MKKVMIEFSREKDGTRSFLVYREGEKRNAKAFRSQYLAFSHMQTLYATQGGVRGIAA